MRRIVSHVRLVIAVLLVLPILIVGVWELRRTYVFRLPFVR